MKVKTGIRAGQGGNELPGRVRGGRPANHVGV